MTYEFNPLSHEFSEHFIFNSCTDVVYLKCVFLLGHHVHLCIHSTYCNHLKVTDKIYKNGQSIAHR